MINTMKINLIIPSFYPAVIYGGPIFSTLHTCTELAKLKDVDLKVVTTNANRDSKLDLDSNSWIQLNDFFVKYYDETIIGKLSLSMVLNCWREIRDSDIIHVQSIFSTPTPLSLFYSYIFRKNVLISPRGSLGVWCLNNGSRFKNIWLNLLIRPLTKNVIWHATSNQERNEIKSVFPNSNVEIIPNGIDLEYYSKPKKYNRDEYCNKFLTDIPSFKVDKIITSMGRIQSKKGFDILIKSFYLVLKQYPNSILLIAGDDEGYLNNLLRIVEELNLKKNVYFVGCVSGQDKVDFFANSDLFVLPSHNENFGNVYIESLAAGTPIVASLNTPWSEVESANCGKWVNNSVEETKEAMFDLLHKDREVLRKNSIAFSVKYDWKNVALQFHNLFHSMVGDNE